MSRIIGLACDGLIGLQAATQFVAWTFAHAPALGPALPLGAARLYAPWSIVAWHRDFAAEEARVFAAAAALLGLGIAAGLAAGLLFEGERRVRRRRGWGGGSDARDAGLPARAGCVQGLFRGRPLVTADPRPTLVTGGTRSGKGRGHVVPSLLCWPESALVHDPKGGLWTATAGWRGGFSHVLRFALADLDGAAEQMLRAQHRPGPDGQPATHRFVRTAVTGYNAGPDLVARLGRVPAIPETQAYVDGVIACFLALTAGRRVASPRYCRSKSAGGPEPPGPVQRRGQSDFRAAWPRVTVRNPASGGCPPRRCRPWRSVRAARRAGKSEASRTIPRRGVRTGRRA
jgi:hypothetical protein